MSSGTKGLIDVLIPAAGESVTEGTLLEWRAGLGDEVTAGETIVEVSTDKVDLEVPSPASGTLAEMLVSEGDSVTVGQVIGRIATESGEGEAEPASHKETAAVEAAMVGSGPGGRIVKADVPAASPQAHTANGAGTKNGRANGTARHDGGANGKASSPAARSGAAQRPLRGSAALLARNMEDSRSIPTATSFRTFPVTILDGRRRELREATGRRISFTHLIAYAVAKAAGELEAMSEHYAVIDDQPHRVSDGQVNLGLAVDVERSDGSRSLLVPVIRDAAGLSFAEFLEIFDELVVRARTSAIAGDDLAGANITLTNPGALGTAASVPRLMEGQGTVIATGAIGYPPGLANVAEAIGAEKVITMTSTYDHRIIQGAQSGRFLTFIETCLQGGQGFYQDIFEALGVALGPAPTAPTRAPASPAEEHPSAAPGSFDEEILEAVQAATALLEAFRTHGHLAARLDPLGSPPKGDPTLDPDSLGLTPEMMARIPARVLQMYVSGKTLADALPQLRETYCGTMAYEIEHIGSHRQRVWLREHIESGAFREPLTEDERRTLLKRLVEVDALERFLHKAYIGQHQFSIEGLDMAVPMLDELIQLSAGQGAQEVVIGMAHRGRLNVLAHNLGRPYDTIFAEFEGASTLEAVTAIPQGGTGDVKYHHGSQGSYELPDGQSIRVNLESNPSHLEHVSPVVVGATRAAQTTRQGPRAQQNTDAAVPIVIHGDSAFPAEGVVAETFNLQGLDGYKVGGTIHLITNNQIGFTTDPDEARSTHWASDLAKGFDVPIIHVNADDVPGCLSAVRLAFAFRQEFGHDVLIDLIGYRRYGHNESDEPAYTQPEMYAKIKAKKRVSDLWAEQLVSEGVITQEQLDQLDQGVWDNLTLLHQRLQSRIKAAAEHESVEHGTGEYRLDRSPSPDFETALPAADLRRLGLELLRVPEGFTVHPKLVRQLERRREALAEASGNGSDAQERPRLDWGHAEALAFASLLGEAKPIRLTGQDTERGTFSQRHLVWHDAKTGQTVCPIQSLPAAQAPFELHNSPLSELACLGFEYGYSQEAPETLVLWEAQFGDFVNAAQVIIDQFVSSGLAKWGQTSRLTLLLPHGYEGRGPEHSSARLERFLALCAEGNIRVANLTTPAQYFHLLRRQAHVAKQRPLVIMTPKSLLRLPEATSPLEELSEGSRFHAVLPEPGIDPRKVERLLLCTGKIYYDLIGHPDRKDNPGVAVGRVELLYPFPEQQIRELMAGYPNLNEILWVQEEPRNMGARAHMFPRLMQIMDEQIHFGYLGRPERASPGEGYPAAHHAEQNRILHSALDLTVPISQYPRKAPGER